MRRKQLGWLLVINLVSSVGYGQENLIPHPSFEPLDSCSYAFISADAKNIGWKSYKYSTVDIWSCCYDSASFNHYRPPNTVFGYQEPYHSCSYLGLGINVHDSLINLSGKEIVGTRLKKPLKRGVKYCFNGWFSRSDEYPSLCGGFQIVFLDYEIHSGLVINSIEDLFTPEIANSINLSTEAVDSVSWRNLKTDYIANGGETYIYLGYFWEGFGSIQSCSGNLGTANRPIYSEYFFIDDVSLMVCNEPSIELSNVFSPNGDGINDVYSPIFKGEIPWIQFEVYNRWGKLMYQTNDRTAGWDGSIENGNQAAEGVYFVVVKTLDEEKKLETKSSYIHLVR